METKEFAVGDKVEHPKFGKGTITAVLGQGENGKVVVNFGKELGERKFVIGKANFRKISERPRLEAFEGGTGGGEAKPA